MPFLFKQFYALLFCQMLPRGRVYRYPPGRNMPDVSIPGVGGGGMLSLPPYDMGGMPLRDAAAMPQPMPISALATALANAPPDQQRTVRMFAIVNYHLFFSSCPIYSMLEYEKILSTQVLQCF